MQHKFINIIASPFFIAMVLFASVFFFIPVDMFEKHKLIPVSNTINMNENSYIFLNDLNHDGKSERIKRYVDKMGMNAMNVYTIDGTIIDQFNFGREAILTTTLFAFDQNNNGLQEIYTLSHSNDSIFLNWVEPLNENDNIPKSRFVTKMKINKFGLIDYPVKSFDCSDLDNDGHKEIVFVINGGYSKFPRKIFAYDFKADSITCSPFTGVNCSITDILDINNDGYVEIFLNTHATANIKSNDSILDDEHSYLMVLDHHLNFLFEPVPFFGYPSNIHSFPVYYNNKWVIAARFSSIGKIGDKSKLVIFDSLGEMINEKEFDVKACKLFTTKNKDNSCLGLYFYNSGVVQYYDLELNEISQTQIYSNLYLNQYDLDGDSINEWISIDKSDFQTILIYRNDFTHPASIKLPIPGACKYALKPGFIQNGDKTLLHIQKDE